MRAPHPSGRPIRKQVVKGRPIWRIPTLGYETPRLQDKKGDLSVIGFLHRYTVVDEEERS